MSDFVKFQPVKLKVLPPYVSQDSNINKGDQQTVSQHFPSGFVYGVTNFSMKSAF